MKTITDILIKLSEHTDNGCASMWQHPAMRHRLMYLTLLVV